MHFVRSVYVWASQGCPDAVPKGVIAVDLEDTVDLSDDLKEIATALCSGSFFDDSCWQVGCSQDDVDLIVKSVPHGKYGEMGVYLTSDQLMPSWQFEQFKSKEGLAVSEHHYLDMEVAELEDCIC